MKMTFGDGFLFGCGFNLAVLVAYIILLGALVLLVLVFGVTAGSRILRELQPALHLPPLV